MDPKNYADINSLYCYDYHCNHSIIIISVTQKFYILFSFFTDSKNSIFVKSKLFIKIFQIHGKITF